MNYILDNFMAIFAATIAAFVFGGLYYRFLRGPWLKAAGPNATTAEQRPGILHYMAIFTAEFWMAAILAGAVILAPTEEAGPWVMALGSAIVIWIGFVLPALFVSYRIVGLSGKLTFIDATHWLLAMTLMAFVIRAIGVVQPTV